MTEQEKPPLSHDETVDTIAVLHNAAMTARMNYGFDSIETLLMRDKLRGQLDKMDREERKLS